MAVANFYGLFFKSLCNKEIDLDTDVIKLMLTTSSYVPNQNTHQYKSSVTNEVSGTGYTAGGATVGSVAVSYNSSTKELSFDGADVTWGSSTITNAHYGVLYDSTPGSDATRPLIGYVDFGVDLSSAAGVFSVTWDSTGIGGIVIA